MRTARRLEQLQEYYFSKKLREVRQLVSEGKPIINLGIGSPDLAPHPRVVDALQNALTHQGVHQYQSYQGIPALREAMAGFYQRFYGVSLDASSEVLPLMGSKEGIMHISLAFLNAGDKVLIPNPGYPTYSSVTRMVEAEAVYYALKEEQDWFPDLDALEQSDLSRVKLMWINYPHMPSGAKASEAQLDALLHFCQKHQILPVNDNPYGLILNETPQSLVALAQSRNIPALELNSLSKSFNMAGWRVGMLVGEAPLIQAVLKVKSNMDSGMFYGIQQAAVAALQTEQDWLNDLNGIYAQRRERVWDLADSLDCQFKEDSAGLFVWAKLPEGSIGSEEFIDHLLYEHSLFVAPGTIFGPAGEGFIRFSLCVEEARIEEALQRVKTGVR
jgi:aspartate/methionine/tyrosine aminotransferase